MSLVERVAARLTSVDAPAPNESPANANGPVAEDVGAAVPQPNAIERAIGGAHEPPLIAADRQPGSMDKPSIATAERALGAASAPQKRPRMLEVDREWLRRNNILTPDAERTPLAENFRRIKRHVLTTMNNVIAIADGKPDIPPNLVMVTSALPGDGKTYCVINLAISLAMELDRSVLLVDADSVRSNVLQTLGVEPGLPGLMDVLGERNLTIEDVLHRTSIDKLSVLPAGTAHRNATELLASEAMRALIDELAARYDDRIVLFDSPPLLLASEAAVLASRMSQIVMVVAADQTPEAALKDALRRIEGCKHVGLLLNKGQDPGFGSGYHYGYGYGYGSGDGA